MLPCVFRWSYAILRTSILIDCHLVTEGSGVETQDEIATVTETETPRHQMMGDTLGARTLDRSKNGEPAGTEM